MQITAKVTGNLEKEILKALRPEINTYLIKALPGIKKQIQYLIRGSLENAPEYQSLLGGQLQAELGVVNPQVALDQVVDGLIAGIEVFRKNAVVAGNQISADFEIGILSSDLHEVFSSASQYITEKGKIIPWLEWLLTLGDTIILREYEVRLGFQPGSRTGLATMVTGVRGWKVPTQFSGTVGDNFLTRALDGLDTHIEDIIVNEMNL